ncbi:MAG: PEP-CTERM sorting domain-containing protein [Phycisphaerales bacterium]
MKISHMIVAAAGCALTSAAMADVFTDEAAFLGALDSSYTNDFADVPVGVSPDLMYSSGGFSYTISATGAGSNSLYNDPSIVSTDSAVDSILVTFTSGNVTAVGGNFWATDILVFPTGTDVTITLSDGTVESFTSTGPSDFRGFTSNVAIDSIMIDAVDGFDGTPYWATMDNLTVGAVPAPGALALLGLGGLSATRRRRA